MKPTWTRGTVVRRPREPRGAVLLCSRGGAVGWALHLPAEPRRLEPRRLWVRQQAILHPQF